MFNVGIKGNYVRLYNRGDRPNYMTKLVIKMQAMFTKTNVTRKPKGVTY
jgi:hypothetical protein